MMQKKPIRLALIGWGAIGRATAAMLHDLPTSDLRGIQIVAIAVHDSTKPRSDAPAGAQIISDPDDLAALAPDLVAEAAGRESVGPWGRAALNAGADYIVSSVSAFADATLLDELTTVAATSGAQIHIQPGALAGVGALAAARLMGIDEVEHRIVKPPRAWKGTDAETLCDLNALTGPTPFFRDTASATATAFAKNANVAMTTALAGIGPERTTITLIADPAATTNRHEITASGAFGHLDVTVSNNPLPDNPKTSAMAALSLVRAINNRTSTIII